MARAASQGNLIGRKFKRRLGKRTYTVVKRAGAVTTYGGRISGYTVVTDEGIETFLSESNIRQMDEVTPKVQQSKEQSGMATPLTSLADGIINGKDFNDQMLVQVEKMNEMLRDALDLICGNPTPQWFVGRINKYRYRMEIGAQHSFNLDCGFGMVMRVACDSQLFEAALSRDRMYYGEMNGKSLNGLLMRAQRSGSVVYPYSLCNTWDRDGTDHFDAFGRWLFLNAPVLARTSDYVPQGTTGRVIEAFGNDRDEFGKNCVYTVNFDGTIDPFYTVPANALVRVDSIA